MMVNARFLDNGKTAKDFLDAKFRSTVKLELDETLEPGETLGCPQMMKWFIDEIDLRRRLNGMFFFLAIPACRRIEL